MVSAIQDIFREHFAAYARAHRLSLTQLKAGHAICRCRTAALGGHVQRCPQGHVQRVWYNSCKHRACPVCAFLQVTQWIHNRVRTLLRCDYYHTIFTLPVELNLLWEHDRRRFTRLFFRAAWETLRELLADPRYLGALPGVLATFHSWAQTLWVHPHLHLLITGGGLSPAGRWLPARHAFLLPSRVVSAKFRGKFLAYLRQAVRQGALTLPPSLAPQPCLNLLNRLGRTKWHVMIMPPYTHGRGVLQYLGRYVRGGPVAGRRVTRTPDGAVRLRYKDETRTHTRYVILTVPEFLTRLLRHVPEAGFHHARVYGLFAPGKRAQLQAARAQLGQLPIAAAESLTWQTVCAEVGPQHPERCPVCGALLIRVELPRSGPAPPCPIATQV